MVEFKFTLGDLIRIAQQATRTPVIVRRDTASIAYIVDWCGKAKVPHLLISRLDTYKQACPNVDIWGDQAADVCCEYLKSIGK